MAPRPCSLDSWDKELIATGEGVDPATRIYGSLGTLLFNDKYSDLCISCGGREFKVHRAIVCTQSDFFANACDGPFLVRVHLGGAHPIPSPLRWSSQY
jgi:hypothetical protein